MLSAVTKENIDLSKTHEKKEKISFENILFGHPVQDICKIEKQV